MVIKSFLAGGLASPNLQGAHPDLLDYNFLAQTLFGAFVEFCVEVGVEVGRDLGGEILIKYFAILDL